MYTICCHGAELEFPYFEYPGAFSLIRVNRSLAVQDWKLSAYYLNLSANKNYTLAQHEFSRYLAAGCGLKQDFVESMRDLKLAADNGMANAQYDYDLK
jgi:TPR repeat protein